MDINDIRLKNNEKINELKEIIKTDTSKKLQDNLYLHKKIKRVLDDDAIFFKITANDALNLLKYYYKKDELNEIYLSLTSFEKYMDCKKKFLI